MADGPTAIPASIDELTPAWLSRALDADVASLEVIDAHSGTTGRAKIKVAANEPVPETLFVKLQPFDGQQREFLRAVGMGVAEAKLYAAVGDDLPVRVPRVWHSSFDDSDGSFIMVLEDLVASGCTFPSPDDDDVLDVATSLVDELAKLHAAYWERDISWLGTHALSPGGREDPDADSRMAGGAAIVQSAVDQFADDLPPAFRELGELYITRYRDIGSLFTEGERTLAHCDNHIGNLFVDDGRTGFYDWAVASQFPGVRDVAYFSCNSLPTEVRRTEEDALLSRYRAGLAERGVTLDEHVARDQYRLFATYSWIAAVTTAAMGSRWQPVEVGRRATVRTTQAIIDLDVLGLLHDRLGD
jgi:Phosphotransferase enzyme family